MGAIDRIKTKLADNDKAELTCSPDGSMVTITPRDAGGFETGLAARGDVFTVFFEGWHQDFDSEDEALACLAWGLSTSCRLKVSMRGSSPVAWTTQYKHDGDWADDEVTGLIFIPFWRRKAVVFKQNNILDAA